MKVQLAALTVLCILSCNSLYSKEFYVSPLGSNTNCGAINEPFRTITKARDEARKYAGKEEVTVYLRGGVYVLDETIVFTTEDSGSEEYPVVYSAYQNEKPVISGGETISGWEKDGNCIFKASTNGRVFRQLYVDKKKALRSRYPNSDEYLKLIRWDFDEKTIHLNPGEIKDWRNFKEVEIFIQMSWSIAIMGLDEFQPTPEFDILKVQNPERDIVFKREWPKKMPDQSFHFENAREFIDKPGEWSLDREKQLVYYFPYPGQDMSNVEVIIPTLETLILIKGTLENPIKHIRFRGIKFMHSNWIRTSEKGYLNIQAGQYNVEPTKDNHQFVERPPAAVLVECAHNVVFEKNVFNQLGAVALDLHYGTKECEVVGNVFYDISGTAISHAKLSDPGVEIHLPYHPEDKRELCVNDRIHNNYITNIGFDYGGAIGILSGWPVGVEIDHNEIKDLAYTGISVGWGWTHESNAMRDNKIRWNKIDNPCSLFGDGGGIYTLSEMPGSIIYRNFVCNVGRSEWATGASTKCYFLDEGSGGITFQENHDQAEEGIERLGLHVTGTVTISPKTFDMYESIVSGAGLEKEYEGIKINVSQW